MSSIEIAGKIVARTPNSSAHFFGFFDICPWSFSDDRIVLLRCDKDFLEMPAGTPASVCVWRPDSGDVTEVATTRGWNFQHGARTQWLRDGGIVFNDVSEGRQCARIIDGNGTLRKSLDSAIAALHPNETFGVTGNYARLSDFYSGYGYHCCENRHIPRADPAADGLWRVDLDTGCVSLLLSYEKLCAALGLSFSERMFVTHPAFSPTGRKVLFYLIEDQGERGQSMYLIVYDFDRDAINAVNRHRSSHPTWLDDNRVMVWARLSSTGSLIRRSGVLAIPGARMAASLVRKWIGQNVNAALAEGSYIFETEADNRRALVSAEAFPEDGHPSKHPHREIILCDTYPNQEGYLTLFLYSLPSRQRVDVAKFFHGVATPLLDLRCDLHPRWNRSGDRISVDFCEGGVRGMAIIDPAPALSGLEVNSSAAA